MDMSSIDISVSGMRAQRVRMDLIANNLANVDTTSASQTVGRTPDGQPWVRHVPFRRKMAIFVQGSAGTGGKTFGVSVPKVVDDPTPFRAEHNESHPHAVPASSGEKDAGTVYYPNIHPIVETVDMMAAARAYEANLTAMDTFKSIRAASLRLLG
ncbi:MAG TPA: flagellar basal body rod protein FlgC [Planctomycetota bacterium]|jgi:flagellar basal-body rod protein FlgC|nr:flagellar basal body rod protein FlgC [Planctomycetota bacterium]